ncbi:MAG: helix-turn-helix domain-containing protein [Candidatus Nanohaloarchaea archaeon]
MARSLSELSGKSKDCDFILKFVYGLNELDRRVFRALSDNGRGMKIDSLAAELGKDRSTIYRSAQRLKETDLVEKRKVDYDSGGYYHVYVPESPGEAAEDMRTQVSDWEEKMSEMIEEFRDSCDQQGTD